MSTDEVGVMERGAEGSPLLRDDVVGVVGADSARKAAFANICRPFAAVSTCSADADSMKTLLGELMAIVCGGCLSYASLH